MTTTHPAGWTLQQTLDHLDAEHGWSLPDDLGPQAEEVANGAIPSRHHVLVPDGVTDECQERIPAGFRLMLTLDTAHEARVVARHHADEFAFIRSIPRGQAGQDYFWVQSDWTGRVISWGYGVRDKMATIEDRDAELADWMGDMEQVGVNADIDREEREQAEIDERRLRR